MRVIGLTGSIACGKSTVSAYLVSQGFPVIDGDQISRELTLPDSPALLNIVQVFGRDVLYDDGSLNRRKLGSLIFKDAATRQTLDDLMAPYLLDTTKKHIEEIRVAGSPVCFLDMPLLFEKGYDHLCDAVWTVWLPENKQIERLMQRDGYSYEESLSRIRAVLSSDQKAALADRVIDNSGTVNQTISFVSGLLSEELSLMAESPDQTRIRKTETHRNQADNSISQPLTSLSYSMKRPDSSRLKKTQRKATWRTPLWLKSSLIAVAVFLLTGITAYFLMNAYLHNCHEKHKEDQQNIDRQYPLVYRSLIEEYADEFNLSPAFVSAVIRNESSFNAKAESGIGARGLMQLMPDTANWIAGKLKVSGYAFERMYDPDSNIRFGCWYLNYLSGLYMGDPVTVTAAYHAGQGQVKIWLSDPNLSNDGYTLPFISLPDGPTRNYVGKVLKDYGIYQTKYFADNQYSVDNNNTIGKSESVVIRNR